jgi:hypothetical protein
MPKIAERNAGASCHAWYIKCLYTQAFEEVSVNASACATSIPGLKRLPRRVGKGVTDVFRLYFADYIQKLPILLTVRFLITEV